MQAISWVENPFDVFTNAPQNIIDTSQAVSLDENSSASLQKQCWTLLHKSHTSIDLPENADLMGSALNLY